MVMSKVKNAQHAFSRAARSRNQSSRPGSARNGNRMPSPVRSRSTSAVMTRGWYSASRSAAVSGASVMSHRRSRELQDWSGRSGRSWHSWRAGCVGRARPVRECEPGKRTLRNEHDAPRPDPHVTVAGWRAEVPRHRRATLGKKGCEPNPRLTPLHAGAELIAGIVKVVSCHHRLGRICRRDQDRVENLVVDRCLKRAIVPTSRISRAARSATL
jgi:hypothetical protein